MHPGLEADMPEPCGQVQGALGVNDGAVHIARHPEIGAHGGVDPPEPQVVTERLGQGFSTAQVVEYPPRCFSQGIERGA